MKSLTTTLILTALAISIESPTILAKPSAVELTKLICETLDTHFLQIKICQIAKGPEGRVVLNAQVHPLKNFNNITMKIKMMRKSGQIYRPFFMETTIDVCDFLKDYKRQIPWGIVYSRVVGLTNINHSCPYNHDIIVKNFYLSPNGLKMIPIPKGEYLVNILVYASKLPKSKFQIFFTRF